MSRRISRSTRVRLVAPLRVFGIEAKTDEVLPTGTEATVGRVGAVVVDLHLADRRIVGALLDDVSTFDVVATPGEYELA